MLKDNKQNWMKYLFKKTVSIKEAIKSHNKLIKNLNDMSKIEMNLVCPNCKTFLKSNDGHSLDPQNCTDPYEYCPKKGCNFVIYYEQKEPNVSNKEVVVCPACGSKYYDEDNNVKRCQDCYTIF